MLLNKIQVSEYFSSLQGEGRSMGVPAIFLRLTGCNLMCGGMGTDQDGKLHEGATWRCDTIEVWQQGRLYDFEELVNAMNEKMEFITKLEEGAHLIITGGEPLLQRARIEKLLEYLDKEYILRPVVEIETNGTIIPSDELIDKVDYWNVSPKLGNSGMTAARTVNVKAIELFNFLPGSIFKYVINDAGDIQHIKDLVNNNIIKRKKVWLMPAASDKETLSLKSPYVAKLAMDNGFNFCTRLQVEIWNQTTGV